MAARLVIVALLAMACGPSQVLEFAIEETDGDTDTMPAAESTSGDDPVPPDVGVPSTFIVNAFSPGGEPLTFEVQAGVIVALGGPSEPPASAAVVDLEGAFVVPGFIDSHVHLSPAFGMDQLDFGQSELARLGVVGGVDIAVALTDLPKLTGAWLGAGPLLAGNDGEFGASELTRDILTPDDARAAVDQAFGAGARVISVAVSNTIDDESLAALVERAHEYALPVAARQWSSTGMGRAAAAGADILSNTPLPPLTEDEVEYWGSRTVISTLSLYGGEVLAIDNLRRLHEAGATVLYGTDLGITGVPGISNAELTWLSAAGLTAQEILAAGTTAPAEIWGLDGVGTLTVGGPATFMTVAIDPLDNPSTLIEPLAVWVDGTRI